MATIAVSTNSNYSDYTVVEGDVFALSGGVTLTIDADTEILGVDGAGNWAITGSSNQANRVVVANGATLNLYSGTYVAGGYSTGITGTVRVEGSGKIKYHGTAANPISGALYNYGNKSAVELVGTDADNRATIENVGGGTLSVGWNLDETALYASFAEIKGNVNIRSSRLSCVIDDMVLDENSGTFQIPRLATTSDLNINKLVHKGTGFNIQNIPVADTTEDRLVTSSRIWNLLTVDTAPGINWSDIYYGSFTGGSGSRGATFDGFFGLALSNTGSELTNSYICSTSNNNPHLSANLSLVSRCAFRVTVPVTLTDAGDMVIVPDYNSGTAVTKCVVRECMFFDRFGSGLGNIFMSCFGHENLKIYALQNTIIKSSYLAAQKVVNFGETDAAHFVADMFELYANNVIVGQKHIGMQDVANIVDNAINIADYNCATDFTDGYEATASGRIYRTTPGANDTNVDPGFVDSTVDLESWAVSIGCSAGETDANKIIYAIDAVKSGAYGAEDILQFLEAGVTPTNSDLAVGYNATVDGVVAYDYKGAVEPILRKVEFTNNSDYASSTTIVPQTVTNWTDTDITIDVVPGDLETGPVYVFITSETGIRNDVGYEIEFTLGSSSITDILSSCTLVLTGEDISGLHNNSDTFSGSTYSFGGENIDVYKTYVDVLSSGSFAETGLDLSVLFNYSDVLGENSLSSSFLSIDEIFNYLDNFSANTLSFSSSNISTLRSYSDVLSGEEFSLTVENLLTYNNFQDTLSQLEISFSGENITVTKTYTDNLSELTLLLEVEDISDNYLQSYSDVLSPSSYSYGGLELVTGRVYTDTLSLSTLSFSVSNLVDYKNYSDELNQGSYSSGFDTLNVLKNYTDTLLENSISVTVGEIDFLHNYIDVLSESSNSFSFSSLEVFKNFLDVLSPLELAFSGNSIITELQLVGVTTDNLTGSSFVSDFESISVLRSHLDSLSGNNFEFFVNDISSFHSYTDTLGPDSLSSSVSQIDLFHNYSDIIGNSSYGLSFEDIETTFWDGVYTDVLSNSSFVLSGNNLSIVYNGSLPELWEIVTFINKVSSENVLKINTIEKTFISNLYGVV